MLHPHCSREEIEEEEEEERKSPKESNSASSCVEIIIGLTISSFVPELRERGCEKLRILATCQSSKTSQPPYSLWLK